MLTLHSARVAASEARSILAPPSAPSGPAECDGCMFTYIDPSVRERLIRQGKLRRVDAEGAEIEVVEPAAPMARALEVLGPVPLPMDLTGREVMAQWYAFVRRTEIDQVSRLAADLRAEGDQHLFASLASPLAVNSLLAFGDVDRAEKPLVRVHSNCLTGDVFGSRRCECGPQLAAAIDRIEGDAKGGYLVYMAGHEGRGIGLWAKAATYLLQDSGEDTYQANRSLGLPEDSRDFSDAATILKWALRGRPMRLLSNNPKKQQDLEAHGVRGIEMMKHVVGVSAHNRAYLTAKRGWGHRLEEDDLSGG